MRYLDDEMLQISVYEYESLRDQASLTEHWQKRYTSTRQQMDYSLIACLFMACAILGFAAAYWWPL